MPARTRLVQLVQHDVLGDSRLVFGLFPAQHGVAQFSIERLPTWVPTSIQVPTSILPHDFIRPAISSSLGGFFDPFFGPLCWRLPFNLNAVHT
jgi:hypothetical protein